jgi:WS/DGAT/MGAT family acyltransferase
MDRHVTRTSLPAETSLERHVAARASTPLEPDRPLWHADLVEAGPLSAVVVRTHHALADGGGLVHVLSEATDPVTPPADPPPQRNRPPAADESRIQREAKALVKLGDRMVRRGAGGTPLTDPLVGEKSVAWCPPIPLDRLKAAGRAAGATVNDVYLAAVAGALRAHLGASNGGDVDLDALMPVSVRRPEEPLAELGNRFGLVVVPLPVGTDDPEERRKTIAARTKAIKATTEAEVVVRALATMGRVPRRAQQAWTDAFIGDAVAVVTNVAGPPGPVGVAGTPVTNISLLVPSTGPIGLGVSLFSYAGRATASVISDRATMVDCSAFTTALGDELGAGQS